MTGQSERTDVCLECTAELSCRRQGVHFPTASDSLPLSSPLLPLPASLWLECGNLGHFWLTAKHRASSNGDGALGLEKLLLILLPERINNK